jgi:hypothetical protein
MDDPYKIPNVWDLKRRIKIMKMLFKYGMAGNTHGQNGRTICIITLPVDNPYDLSTLNQTPRWTQPSLGYFKRVWIVICTGNHSSNYNGKPLTLLVTQQFMDG